MASEWAMNKADDLHTRIEIAQRDYLDAAVILADALDAAREQGRNDAQAELAELRREVEELRSRLSMATQFKIYRNPDRYSPFGSIEIHRCEGDLLPKQPYMWAVRMDGFTLSKSGEWEYEPIPSRRDDAYYARCRYDSYEQAESMASVAATLYAVRKGEPK